MSSLGSGARGAAVAAATYTTASTLLLGLPTLADPSHRCVCSGTDPALYLWGLAWWPHAVAHGLDPIHTTAIFAPGGADLAGATTVPGPSLVSGPLTAAFGPLVSYNVLAVASPALAAFCAFLLCRRLTGRFGPALAGGWLFGFSAYELGQLTTHLNLALVFIVPLLALLTIRTVDGELSGPRFAVLAAVSLLGQLSISSEVLFTSTVIGALALATAWLLERPRRGAIARTAAWVLVAYGAMALVAIAYLASALGHGGPVAVSSARQRGADLLSFILPTRLTGIGGGSTLRIAPGSLATGYAETGVYLGAPLIAILITFWAGSWRRPGTRLLLVVFAATAVLSMGAWLRVDGHRVAPLPWALVSDLPVFDAILPIRLGLYATLAAAIAAALWLSRPPSGTAWRGWPRWALAAVAIAALLPALGNGYWSSRPRVPSFFTSSAWRTAIGPRDIALVLPDDDQGAAMLWQATTQIGFRMAGGYLGENGRDPQASDPLRATLLSNGPSTPGLPGRLFGFLTRHRVSVVVVDPQPPGPWPAALASLGLRPQAVGGILLYRIVKGARAAASIVPAGHHSP